MAGRAERLRHLLDLQEKLKAMHEMRRASHLAQATAAARDAQAILDRRDTETSLSSLFPDVYSRFVERALERQRDEEAKAAAEAGNVAVQTARAGMIERNWREARRDEDRAAEERAALELVEQRLGND